jgi:transforming growth factor-beta-induced protein
MKKFLMICAALVLFASPAVAADAPKSIVETAVAAGKFKTLVAAVKAAGLVDALSGKGPLTVFAPTDEAFAKLPKGTVESLLLPENKEKLKAILTYHVAAGDMTADKVVKATEIKTLQGQSIAVKVTDGKVTVDKANVVATDIKCTNGVIHVIDSVILPK